MILISCHIENFGSLKHFDHQFDPNLNSFLENNGAGKTTLAAFLESMFYGMDSMKSNTKNFLPRKHFYPFEGGKFGGNVVFKVADDTYKIERFFDEKSENKDSLTIYKNNDIFTIQDKQVGEYFFGIDRQSFERTIFVDSHEIEISSTGSINTKLNSFVEGNTQDNVETAIERLKEEAKNYKKSRVGNDLITKENECISKLDERIANCNHIKESLPEKYERLSNYEQDLQHLKDELEEGHRTELELKDWEQYDSYLSESDDARNTSDEIEKRYPNGVPTDDELKEIRSHLNAIGTLEGQYQSCSSLSDDDRITLNELENKYHGETPSDDRLDQVRNQIRSYDDKKRDIQHLQNDEELSDDEKSMIRRFDINCPTEEAISEIDDALSSYEEARRIYEDTPDFISEEQVNKPSKTKWKFIVSAIIFAVISVVGIGIIFVNLIAGIIILIVGILGLAITGFLYLNKKSSLSATVQSPNPSKTESERQKNDAELHVQQFLASYGYSSQPSLDYSVEKLKEDYQRYQELCASKKNRQDRLQAITSECRSIEQDLNAFFMPYNISAETFDEQLSKLQEELHNFRRLSYIRDNEEKQKDETTKSIEKHDDELKKFMHKYKITNLTQNIDQIEIDVSTYHQAKKKHDEFLQKAQRFKDDKHLQQRPEIEEDIDIGALTAQERELNQKITTLSKEITDDETEAERLDDLNSEKKKHSDASKQYKSIYAILNKTIDHLRQADKNLKDRYINPIKNNFIYYADILEPTIGEKLVMTSDFEIRYERNGTERSERHLSSGQRSICAFCFRMALVDNMYTEEKPFLILDDPFVNLDEEHLKKVKIMLKQLSERFQILYFTCHESRMIDAK